VILTEHLTGMGASLGGWYFMGALA